MLSPDPPPPHDANMTAATSAAKLFMMDFMPNLLRFAYFGAALWRNHGGNRAVRGGSAPAWRWRDWAAVLLMVVAIASVLWPARKIVANFPSTNHH